MANTGVLDKCLADGRDICFFSNIDNTGACADMRIASAMAEGIADYAMEVTPKTVTDIKVRARPFHESVEGGGKRLAGRDAHRVGRLPDAPGDAAGARGQSG